MKSPVIIKGNKLGIRLIISEEADIDEIISEISNKLNKTSCYYSNIKPIDVTFEGKILTADEEEIIIEKLQDIGLNILSNDVKKYPNQKKISEILSDEDGLFFIGDLKNGQSIEAKTSIVIIGDVEKKASVMAEGNIIVIGQLLGYAKAGTKGRKDAFVYSI